MKLHKIAIITILFFAASFICAEKITIFKELLAPNDLIVNNEQIIISQGTSIFIYSLKDFKLEKKIGEEGEGPQEFIGDRNNKIKVNIQLHPDYILVNSASKVSFFTRNGEFIKEKRVASGFWYQPFGNGFIANDRASEDRTFYFTINMYDADFNKIKEIFRQESWFQLSKDINPIAYRTQRAHTCEDKIIVEADKIHIYNSNGEKIHTIDYPFEKIEVPDNYKKELRDWYNKSNELAEYNAYLNQQFKFPQYFPDIRAVKVADKKIFVLTFKKENSKSEFIIFDCDGKFLKKVWLPLVEEDVRIYYPFSIDKGKYYQLVENWEKSTWELHRQEIK